MGKKAINQATKIFDFACAHMLSNHEGLCANLHGHNYKVEVTFRQKAEGLIPVGPSGGMVCDFKDIKKLCNKGVFDAYDHALVVNGDVISQCEDDAGSRTYSEFTEYQLAQLAESRGLKVVVFPGRPTAELMAEVFYTKINDVLFDNEPTCVCVKVKVFETDTSFAEYFEELV